MRGKNFISCVVGSGALLISPHSDGQPRLAVVPGGRMVAIDALRVLQGAYLRRPDALPAPDLPTHLAPDDRPFLHPPGSPPPRIIWKLSAGSHEIDLTSPDSNVVPGSAGWHCEHTTTLFEFLHNGTWWSNRAQSAIEASVGHRAGMRIFRATTFSNPPIQPAIEAMGVECHRNGVTISIAAACAYKQGQDDEQLLFLDGLSDPIWLRCTYDLSPPV